MKILVPIKLSVDSNQVKFDAHSKEPIADAIVRVFGDTDKCALEEALKLKDKIGAEVTVVTIGYGREYERLIRDAYAMGATKGYVIKVSDPESLTILSVAKLLYRFIEKTGSYDLILIGYGSIDTHSSALPPLLASLLNVPFIGGVDSLNISDNTFEAYATMEDGVYVYRGELPAVISITSEANMPRIPTLRDILKSKKIPINYMTLEELGLMEIDRINVMKILRYEVKRKKQIIEASDPDSIEKAVDLIINVLKEEGII